MRTKYARAIRHGISTGRGQIFTIQHHPDWESMALSYPWLGNRLGQLGEQAAYRTVRAWREKGSPS